DCTPCISGYYCNVEGLADPIDCPAGYFCVSGSVTPQPCPLGTYSNSTGLRRSTDCTPCPGGQYCDGIGRTEPAGLCDAGFYCRERAYTSAPPDGPTGGLCPAGGYCPEGSATNTPCPVGEYSKSSGAKAATDCIPCDPGFFCAGSSSTEASQQCAAGYYCTGGAGIATQFDTPAGHYTLEGAHTPIPCPAGQYQQAQRSSSCEICPQSFYCNGTGTIDTILCPSGHYCPLGSEYPTPCPPGTYNPNTGMYELAHCLECEEGYACQNYGMSNSQTTPCSAGYYCGKGSNTTIPVGMSFGDVCPLGEYCPEGSPEGTHCPNGTYSNVTGLHSESQCISCDPGRVCSGSGLTAPNGLCAAGYYCRGSAYTDRPRDGGATGDVCPKGHYCPEGTGEPNTCIPGSFNNVTGLDYCFDCPAGFYCVDGEIPLACPRGRYCPGNTTAAQPYCPRGTYNPDFGMVYESDCRPCLGGYYCDTLGATEFDPSLNNTGVGKCAPSYYCKS
ncbi:hypothetical protein EGW08_011308, partial [Elysia chlorotica]